MSNPFDSLIHGDPRQTQLVERLIERTEAETIAWQRTPTTYETELRNGTRVGFVVSPNAFVQLLTRIAGSGGWIRFSVRRGNDDEIFAVDSATILPSSETPPDPLRSAINKLFAAVSRKHSDKLDDVLGELDQT